jgi:formate dehydrogenase
LGRATIYIKARRKTMAKVIAVLYPDPVDGYPKKYARDDIPKITKYPDGQTAPTPSAIDFKPGELLGSVSGELGLRKFLEKAGHTLVVTSSKDGKDSVLDKELPDAEIVISQPFWPAYMTKERIDKAKKLKLIITAGIGSDHTDLQAAMDKGISLPLMVSLQGSAIVGDYLGLKAPDERRANPARKLDTGLWSGFAFGQ